MELAKEAIGQHLVEAERTIDDSANEFPADLDEDRLLVVVQL